MRIFNGKKIAEQISSDLKKKIKKTKIKPKLAVILVGDDAASKLFIKNKKRAAREIGVKVSLYKFKKTIRKTQGKKLEKEIIQKIKDLNKDSAISGIIVQLPLPKGFNAGKILIKINPKKDVDGFHKNSRFSSPLISAILIALKKSTKNLKNKNILSLVNSDIFGRTLKQSLGKEGIKISYLKDRKSPKIKLADIIITVRGCPKFIKGNMIKERAILIDGGITVRKKRKVVGDVDRKSISQKASFLTPVPGGVGPLNVALLLKNVYLATKIK